MGDEPADGLVVSVWLANDRNSTAWVPVLMPSQRGLSPTEAVEFPNHQSAAVTQIGRTIELTALEAARNH